MRTERMWMEGKDVLGACDYLQNLKAHFPPIGSTGLSSQTGIQRQKYCRKAVKHNGEDQQS